MTNNSESGLVTANAPANVRRGAGTLAEAPVALTGRPETQEALQSYYRDLLAHDPRVDAILLAADGDATCCLANAHAAALHMRSDSAVGFRLGRRYLMRARAAARGAGEREKHFAAAIYDWWRGNTRVCLDRLVALVDTHPDDVVTGVWAHSIAHRAGQRGAMLRVSSALVASCPGLAVSWSLHAVSLLQNDQALAAADAAMKALRLSPADPGAVKAMAQVFLARGEAETGAAFLEQSLATGLQGHADIRAAIDWHLAVFYLQQGRHAEACALMDTYLQMGGALSAQALAVVISCLWRLELQGGDAGARWQVVAGLVEARWHEHILPLLDLHFLNALVRDDRQQAARAFVASMERKGEADDTGLWQSVTIPCARALMLFADADYARSAEVLEMVLSRLDLLGGNAAQRDVIVQTCRTARLRAAQDVRGRLRAGMRAAP